MKLTNKELLNLTDEQIKQLGALQKKRLRTNIGRIIDALVEDMARLRALNETQQLDTLARTKAEYQNLKARIA